MTLDKILIILFGGAGILFTYWFFLMRREKEVIASGSIDIIVEGGYSPSTISVQKGKTIKLNFLRRDPSDCLEEVVLSDFKIRRKLPLNKKVTVEVTPRKSGEFPFSCGMNMFHGKLIVEDPEQSRRIK